MSNANLIAWVQDRVRDHDLRYDEIAKFREIEQALNELSAIRTSAETANRARDIRAGMRTALVDPERSRTSVNAYALADGVDEIAASPPAAQGDDKHVNALLAMRSVFGEDRIPPPCAEREAIDAAIAALQRTPEAPMAQVDGKLPPLPQAFFDEIGKGADDRVQDYARAAIAALNLAKEAK